MFSNATQSITVLSPFYRGTENLKIALTRRDSKDQIGIVNNIAERVTRLVIGLLELIPVFNYLFEKIDRSFLFKNRKIEPKEFPVAMPASTQAKNATAQISVTNAPNPTSSQGLQDESATESATQKAAKSEETTSAFAAPKPVEIVSITIPAEKMDSLLPETKALAKLSDKAAIITAGLGLSFLATTGLIWYFSSSTSFKAEKLTIDIKINPGEVNSATASKRSSTVDQCPNYYFAHRIAQKTFGNATSFNNLINSSRGIFSFWNIVKDTIQKDLGTFTAVTAAFISTVGVSLGFNKCLMKKNKEVLTIDVDQSEEEIAQEEEKIQDPAKADFVQNLASEQQESPKQKKATSDHSPKGSAQISVEAQIEPETLLNKPATTSDESPLQQESLTSASQVTISTSSQDKPTLQFEDLYVTPKSPTLREMLNKAKVQVLNTDGSSSFDEGYAADDDSPVADVRFTPAFFSTEIDKPSSRSGTPHSHRGSGTAGSLKSILKSTIRSDSHVSGAGAALFGLEASDDSMDTKAEVSKPVIVKYNTAQRGDFFYAQALELYQELENMTDQAARQEKLRAIRTKIDSAIYNDCSQQEKAQKLLTTVEVELKKEEQRKSVTLEEMYNLCMDQAERAKEILKTAETEKRELNDKEKEERQNLVDYVRSTLTISAREGHEKSLDYLSESYSTTLKKLSTKKDLAMTKRRVELMQEARGLINTCHHHTEKLATLKQLLDSMSEAGQSSATVADKEERKS